MKTFSLQSSFNNGVLDEKMAARLDIKQYFQGLSVGDNIRCLPQGGIKRRPGTKYIDDADAGVVRLIPFIFNTDQTYLLVFTNLQVKVYRNDSLVDTVVTPYLAADLHELDYAQTADTMIIVHEDYQPRTLVRGATDADFTLSTITFIDIPEYDYNDASSPTPTSEIQQIDFTSGFNAGDTFILNLEGLETYSIPFNEDTTAQDRADMEEKIRAALQDLANTGNDGISVAHAGGTDDQYDITFADAAANDWLLITGRADQSATPSTAQVWSTRTQTGVPRREDVWSSTRGWPRTVTFFEGRLWFGGSKSRPHTIWGSRVNNFFSFKAGQGRANEAIDVTLDTDQINRIQSIVGGRQLSVYTIGGEFVFKKATNEPITPENVAILPQTSFGSKRIKPVISSGSQMFIQRTGKAMLEFVYNFDVDAFDSSSLTLLNPSVISDPTEMVIQRGSSAEDATYIYLMNDNGEIAVFNSDPGNAIAAWSTWKTNGDFLSIAVVLDDVYVAVDRGSSNYFIEKFSNDYYTDAGVQDDSPASATISGLAHLNGYECRVKEITTHKVLPNETPAAGSVTLPYQPDDVEIGLDFAPTLTTLPVVQDQGAGHNLHDKMRINRVTLEVVDSMKINVNGYCTGLKELTTGRTSIVLTGWSERPTVTISQCDPVPMTLLGINLEVNA